MLLDAKFPLRYVFQRICPAVVRVLPISVFFHLLLPALGDYLPLIPLQLPTILGNSVSRLLAFKTSQSYDRWWEVRKSWGSIVNDSLPTLTACTATPAPTRDGKISPTVPWDIAAVWSRRIGA